MFFCLDNEIWFFKVEFLVIEGGFSEFWLMGDRVDIFLSCGDILEMGFWF